MEVNKSFEAFDDDKKYPLVDVGLYYEDSTINSNSSQQELTTELDSLIIK